MRSGIRALALTFLREVLSHAFNNLVTRAAADHRFDHFVARHAVRHVKCPSCINAIHREHLTDMGCNNGPNEVDYDDTVSSVRL